MKKLKPTLLNILISGFILLSPCSAVDKITSQQISQEIEKIKSDIRKSHKIDAYIVNHP